MVPGFLSHSRSLFPPLYNGQHKLPGFSLEVQGVCQEVHGRSGLLSLCSQGFIVHQPAAWIFSSQLKEDSHTTMFSLAELGMWIAVLLNWEYLYQVFFSDQRSLETNNT